MSFPPLSIATFITAIILLKSIVHSGAFIIPNTGTTFTKNNALIEDFVFIRRRSNTVNCLYVPLQQHRSCSKVRLYMEVDSGEKEVESNEESTSSVSSSSKISNTTNAVYNIGPIWSKVQSAGKTIVNNTFSKDKDFGSRGELMVMMQFVLSVLILLGKVPLLQHLIDFIFGPVLFLGGLLLSGQAIRELKTESFTALTHPVPIKKGGKFITSGVYSYVRHPVYTGNILTLIGLSMMTQSAMRCFLSILYYILVDLKASEEEKNMVKEFGYMTYQKYRTKVKGKFFPHWDIVSGRLMKAKNGKSDGVNDSDQENSDDSDDETKGYMFP